MYLKSYLRYALFVVQSKGALR